MMCIANNFFKNYLKGFLNVLRFRNLNIKGIHNI